MTISPNTAKAAAEAIRRGHQAGGPGHDEDDACAELARRVEAEGKVPDQLSALDMAVNLAGRVQVYAQLLNDPDSDRRLQAHIAQAGERAHTGAQLAANLALVSIAQDLHQAAQLLLMRMEGWAEAKDQDWSVGTLADPDSPISQFARNEGPLADARRTREHMRSWASGQDTHPGEGTDPDEELLCPGGPGSCWGCA